MAPFTVGDLALYLVPDGGPMVVKITDINYNVPYGEDPEISIKLGPDGNIRETILERLLQYKTPTTPPGITYKFTPETQSQMEDVEDYLIDYGPGISQEEKDILKELNDDATLTVSCGGERECALSSMDGKDLNDFEDACNMREERHRVIAKSPQTWDSGAREAEIDCIVEYYNNGKTRKAKADDDSELDVNNRLLVEATILNKGPKHDNAVTKFGKVYIDKKFTRYVPEIGEKVKMVIGMKGCAMTHPWNCYKIV